MKVTYLVFENGIGSALRVATKEEWNRIMAENRTLPRERRRFFIRDCIEDCEVIDSLYIEVDKDSYDVWHRENQQKYEKRVKSANIITFSIDIPTKTSEGLPLVDIISDRTDWEEKMIDDILLMELREKLAAWKEWANELLDYYLAGEQMAATKMLAKKYVLSEQLIRRRKRELETYIKKYFVF